MYRELLPSSKSDENTNSPLSVDTPCLVLDFETFNIADQKSSNTENWVVTCIGGCIKPSPESNPITFGITPRDNWSENMLFRELINNFDAYSDKNLDKTELCDFERIITFNGDSWDLNFIKRNKRDLYDWITYDDTHLDVRKYLKRRLIEHSILKDNLQEYEYPALEEALKAWGGEPDVVYAPSTISGELVSGNTNEISRKIMNGEASNTEKEALKKHAIADCKNTLELYNRILKSPKPTNEDKLR